MATEPVFATTPVLTSAAISTANTNLDGSGTLGTVATGATNGTVINRVSIQATGTTSAGMVRLFIDDTLTKKLYREVPVTAVTPSGTLQAFAAVLDDLGLVLPNGVMLKAAPHQAEGFNVFAEGASY